MLSTKFNGLKKLAALGSVATMCGFAKAETKMGEIEDVVSLPNGEMIVQKSGAQIGIDTPFMFARPDGQSAFANDFTTNATEVVADETGTNIYANANGKITHFTLDKNGFPSKQGDEFGLMNSDGTTTNTTAKLVAAKDGKLITLDSDKIYLCSKNGNTYASKTFTHTLGTVIDTYFDGENLYALGAKRKGTFSIQDDAISGLAPKHNLQNPTKIIGINGTAYCGTADGKVENFDTNLGAITGLSIATNGNIIATSTNSTNYCEIIPNKSVSDPIPTGSSEKVQKIIDNRAKNGKMLYVTKSGFGKVMD